MIRLLLTVAAACLAGAPPAEACSVRDDYRVPSNLEMVEQADVIFIGVVEEAPADSSGLENPQMVVRSIEVLKGGPLPERFRLHGMLAPARFAVLSNQNELEQAHPLAQIGSCIRFMFVQGSSVLFFLDREQGELVPLAKPFSRWAEDVASPSARWAKAVRLYVEVAALPEGERRAALQLRRETLLAQRDDADAAAIAADIDRSLRGPNRSWNELIREEIGRPDKR